MGLIDYADVIAETTADDRGRFVFDHAAIPAAMTRVAEDLRSRQRGADVVVLADGYGLSWAPVFATEISDAIEITLDAAATLQGGGDEQPTARACASLPYRRQERRVVGKQAASLVVRPEHVIGDNQIQVTIVVQVGEQDTGASGIARREANRLVVVQSEAAGGR